jgi:GNAT superfamily N-acetyltransferase
VWIQSIGMRRWLDTSLGYRLEPPLGEYTQSEVDIYGAPLSTITHVCYPLYPVRIRSVKLFTSLVRRAYFTTTMSPEPRWSIEPSTPETIDEVVLFINNARRDMFPELCAQLKDDVARWVQSGCFLIARDEEEQGDGRVIATIGYVPYDHRFPQLQYNGKKTVEVVRLYVLPHWRRYGLAAALFEGLRKKAIREEVDVMYLHTHPFLPGALRFWDKHGFRVVDVEDDQVWRTTHMELMLKDGKS